MRRGVLAVLCLNQLLVFVDSSILNVTIPTLVRTLGATPSQAQWIVDAYVLVFAGLLLTAGRVGDRFGRRRLMTIGLVVLGLGSLVASITTAPAQLIVARAVMGVGAALVAPSTLSILVNVFTEPGARRKAIAYWSLMNAAGLFVGPITGGLLLREFWWGACFLVNVPIVALCIVVTRIVPESSEPSTGSFDIPGALTSSIAMAALVWAIIEGPSYGWGDPWTIAGLVVAVVAALVFVRWESKTPQPMLDLTVFRSRQLTAAAAAMTVAFVAMVGAMFLITQSLQLAKGYTPLAAALATSGPIVAVNVLVVPRAPRLIERFGARRMMTCGLLIVACSALVIAQTTVDSGYANLFVGFALMAFAFSICAPAATDAIMTAVTIDRSGGASAINQMTRQFGAALGVAITGSVAAVAYRAGFDVGGTGVPPSVADSARSSITAAIAAGGELQGTAALALAAAANEAFLHGVRYALFAVALIALGGAIFARATIPNLEPVTAVKR